MTELLTYERFDQLPIDFSDEDETKGALEVLQWAYAHYGEKLYMRVALELKESS